MHRLDSNNSSLCWFAYSSLRGYSHPLTNHHERRICAIYINDSHNFMMRRNTGLKLKYLRASYTQQFEFSQGVRTHLTHIVCMGGDLAPNLGGPKKIFAAQFQEKFPFSGYKFLMTFF